MHRDVKPDNIAHTARPPWGRIAMQNRKLFAQATRDIKLEHSLISVLRTKDGFDTEDLAKEIATQTLHAQQEVIGLEISRESSRELSCGRCSFYEPGAASSRFKWPTDGLSAVSRHSHASRHSAASRMLAAGRALTAFRVSAAAPDAPADLGEVVLERAGARPVGSRAVGARGRLGSAAGADLGVVETVRESRRSPPDEEAGTLAAYESRRSLMTNERLTPPRAAERAAVVMVVAFAGGR